MNQGICASSEELKVMTKRDCYEWCMSIEYNDSTCANECGLKKDKSQMGVVVVIGVVVAIFCLVLLCVRLRRKKEGFSPVLRDDDGSY